MGRTERTHGVGLKTGDTGKGSGKQGTPVDAEIKGKAETLGPGMSWKLEACS